MRKQLKEKLNYDFELDNIYKTKVKCPFGEEAHYVTIGMRADQPMYIHATCDGRSKEEVESAGALGGLCCTNLKKWFLSKITTDYSDRYYMNVPDEFTFTKPVKSALSSSTFLRLAEDKLSQFNYFNSSVQTRTNLSAKMTALAVLATDFDEKHLKLDHNIDQSNDNTVSLSIKIGTGYNNRTIATRYGNREWVIDYSAPLKRLELWKRQSYCPLCSKSVKNIRQHFGTQVHNQMFFTNITKITRMFRGPSFPINYKFIKAKHPDIDITKEIRSLCLLQRS